MVNRVAVPVSLCLSALTLAACQLLAPQRTPAPPPAPAPLQSAPAAVRGAEAPMVKLSLDEYKRLVASQIQHDNPDRIFNGRLPPMLPAIVVLGIRVDQDGAVKEVVVQRSRDAEASAIAMSAVKHCGMLPKPRQLLREGGTSLEFSETFLFNEQYRFQLRTLAGVQ